MKNIIVMCPTVERAARECAEFANENKQFITEVHLFQRRVKLINDDYIWFKGETEGQRAVKGTHADIIFIDEFAFEEAHNENKKDS